MSSQVIRASWATLCLELLGLLVAGFWAVGVAGFLTTLGPSPLSTWALAVLICAPPLIAAVALRRLWLPLFGPVLFYDLVRSARRGRTALLRSLYAAALLVMLLLFYASWAGSLFDAWSVQGVHPNEAARFAESFFHWFISVQFVAVAVLTPALTAGALAEEKDRGTLEYLFTTDLRSHEIVLGKLASRLAAVLMLALTGLPVLTLLLFLGGVDPNQVVGGFVVTGVTLFSLACLSILNSAYLRKPVTAILLTYVEVGAYLAVSTLLAWTMHDPGKRDMGDALIEFLGLGNIWLRLEDLELLARSPAGLAARGIWWLVGKYALFHVAVAGLALLLATVPLRAWVKRQASGRGRRSFVLALAQRRLPRVGREPMVWKEVYAEPTFRFNRTGMVLTATFVSVCLILCTFLMIVLFVLGLDTGTLALRMNAGARTVGTFLALLLLLGVAVRAAGCFSNERDRQTLVSLLSTPIPNRDILWGKWLGSVLCVRKMGCYLALVWLACTFTGGLHFLALPLLVVAWVVYALFLASLGLWFSLVSRNTLRATTCTVATLLGVCVGPWFLAFFCSLVFSAVARPPTYGPSNFYGPTAYAPVRSGWSVAAPELLSVLSPPSSLHFLAFSGADLNQPRWSVGSYGDFSRSYGPSYGDVEITDVWVKLVAVIFSLLLYTLAAFVLWRRSLARFAELTGRMPVPGRGPPQPARSKA
jgi:ABC-type transport system involved in multi-copper enzyme maturation permease subunit